MFHLFVTLANERGELGVEPDEVARHATRQIGGLLSDIIEIEHVRAEPARSSRPEIVLSIDAATPVDSAGDDRLSPWGKLIERLLLLREEHVLSPLSLANVVFSRNWPDLPSVDADGIWLDIRYDFPRSIQLRRLLRLKFDGAQDFGRFEFFAFPPKLDESTDHDIRFTPIEPGEVLSRLGMRVNTNPVSSGPELGFTCQLMPGSTINSYIISMYRSVLSDHQAMGGTTVLLTTILQMNDKTELINHVTERLDHPEHLTLYTLSALNLEHYNKHDPNHYCSLISEGRLRIRDIVLGV